MQPTSLGVTASAARAVARDAHPAPPLTLAADTRCVRRPLDGGMIGRLTLVASVVLVCAFGCASSRNLEAPQVGFVGEPIGGHTSRSRVERNLLLDPETRKSTDVMAALECALRYAMAGSPTDTLCFVTFGADGDGEWVDPPAELLEVLSDLPIGLAPGSAAGLRPIPPQRDEWFTAVQQPMIPGALCQVSLREWVASSRAEFYISITTHDWPSLRGIGSAATVVKLNGAWSLVDWKAERRQWSSN